MGRVFLRNCANLFRLLVLVAAAGFWLAGRDTLAFDGDRLQTMAARQDIGAQQTVRALLDSIARAASQPEELRLEAINQFFNRRIYFREDIDVWGQVDYWASPLETIVRGQGDCEDYAIAKYFSLQASGISVSKLRLVYVRAALGPPAAPPVAHMVLAYYATPAADPLILDNLVPEVLPASRRRDLTPVFSFNTEGLWQGTQGNEAGDPLARLSRWREVVAKARQEGF
jgi:predicted transglutaminase-like cysteine proteinase